MKLIFIHGRGQENMNPVELEKEWVDALKAGLAKHHLNLPEDTEIIFPFYGNLLQDLISKLDSQENIEGIVARGELDANDEIAFYNLLKEITDQSGITSEQINALEDADLIERGWEHHRPVLMLLRAIDRYTGIGAGTIKKNTYDVFCYLTYSAIKRQINKLVEESMPKEPVIVVAHSLGTVIAYNVLYDLPENYSVKKLITVGSPLGVKWIKAQVRTPLKMPTCVEEGWYNAFDPRDVVALNELNSGAFNIIPLITNYHGVNNPTDNRHGITGYLIDPNVAKVIYDALSS